MIYPHPLISHHSTGRYFTDGEIEGQRGQVAGLKSADKWEGQELLWGPPGPYSVSALSCYRADRMQRAFDPVIRSRSLACGDGDSSGVLRREQWSGWRF